MLSGASCIQPQWKDYVEVSHPLALVVFGEAIP